MFKKLLVSAITLLLLLSFTACGQTSAAIPVITLDSTKEIQVNFRESQGISSLLAIPEYTPLTLYFQDGSIKDLTAQDQVSLRRGKLYVSGITSPIRGIVLNPPEHRVTHAYGWALKQIQEGNQALVILIDGFSWEQYVWAFDQGIIPNLAGGQAFSALTVYRPVTNAGMAAIITGVTPEQSGIHHRGHRIPQVPDMLHVLAGAGKRGIVIETDINILQMGGEVVLNLDQNGDGYTDDEVLAAALLNIPRAYDYMLVHFHSLDAAGHSFGPYAQETIQRLQMMDEYVGQLLSAWPGPVLVVSDHGMHKTDEGGSHGEFRHEDMFVPFIQFGEERP